jgi:hypothetical protein
MGEPPTELTWDGRDRDGRALDGGGLYAAQLTVIGATRNVEAASAWVVFGVNYRQREPRHEIWPGESFATERSKLKPGAALRAHVTALAATITAEDRLLIEVHGDGSGDSLEVLARTQREADAVARLFHHAGVAAARVEARGRGSLEPLEAGNSDTARQRNRRIAVSVQSSSTGQLRRVPRYLTTRAQLTVEGERVDVDSRGRFFLHPTVPARGAVLVDVQCADGRRAAIDAPLGSNSR